MFLEIENAHGNKTVISTDAIVKIHYCATKDDVVIYKIILKTKVFELITEETYKKLKEKLNAQSI